MTHIIYLWKVNLAYESAISGNSSQVLMKMLMEGMGDDSFKLAMRLAQFLVDNYN